MPVQDHLLVADATEDRMTLADALANLREALAELESVPEETLDEPTRRLRDATRALLDRYARDSIPPR